MQQGKLINKSKKGGKSINDQYEQENARILLEDQSSTPPTGGMNSIRELTVHWVHSPIKFTLLAVSYFQNISSWAGYISPRHDNTLFTILSINVWTFSHIWRKVEHWMYCCFIVLDTYFLSSQGIFHLKYSGGFCEQCLCPSFHNVYIYTEKDICTVSSHISIPLKVCIACSIMWCAILHAVVHDVQVH